MANEQQSQPIAVEIINQVDEVLKKLHSKGIQWLQGVAMDDPRRVRYMSSRSHRLTGGPSTTYVVKDSRHISDYLRKPATNDTGSTYKYLVVKPDAPCLADKDKVLALIRPVLKTNFDNRPCLNFHVWFHHLAENGTVHYLTGWRLEEPEGNSSTHDYYHAQPLKKFGEEGSVHGISERQSERFPTIPLAATDIVELCLTAVLITSGKEALRSLVCAAANPGLRDSARRYWTKVFSSPFPAASHHCSE